MMSSLCKKETSILRFDLHSMHIKDNGAFVEIAPEQIVKANIEPKKGQEYRYRDERYASHVKYQWLTAKDGSDCKIYFQKNSVSYADYIPGMYYISPYEVDVTPEDDIGHRNMKLRKEAEKKGD